MADLTVALTPYEGQFTSGSATGMYTVEITGDTATLAIGTVVGFTVGDTAASPTTQESFYYTLVEAVNLSATPTAIGFIEVTEAGLTSPVVVTGSGYYYKKG